jgi:hypothetical protein
MSHSQHLNISVISTFITAKVIALKESLLASAGSKLLVRKVQTLRIMTLYVGLV